MKQALTPDEFRLALGVLDLTQEAACQFLGVNRRTLVRWVAGDSRIPAHVVVLLRYMLRAGLTPAQVLAAIAPPKRR